TAILLTASRGAFLTMLVALAIIPATQGRLRLRTKVALCTLAVASLALAASFVPEATLERLQTTRADIESGYFGNRGFIWRGALGVGSLSLEWGYRKQFWFVLGIVAAEAALRLRPQEVIDLGSPVGSPRPRAAVRRVLAADR